MNGVEKAERVGPEKINNENQSAMGMDPGTEQWRGPKPSM